MKYAKKYLVNKWFLTLNNNSEINIKSITTDFEKSLINNEKKIFANIRQIGCLFHYVQSLRHEMRKYDLFK